MSICLVDRSRGEAVYRQIARILQQEIQSCYEAGDFLPSEQELAERFSVNRHTLRRAVDELVDSGLLVRRHGKGTQVLAPVVDYAIGQGTRFSENIAAQGLAADSSVIRKLVLRAQGGVARRLQLEEGSEVLMLETLRQVDGTPFILSSHFLPLRGFEPVRDHYSGGSLHTFIADRCQRLLKRSESLVTATLPQGDDAALLQMSPHQPVLRTKSVNVDIETGEPVEYTLSRFRADRVQLMINP